MRIGVLGTGVVGSVLGAALVRAGHEVMMGAREPSNEKAATWVAETGAGASQGTFAEAAAFGELVINAVSGEHTLRALSSVAEGDLEGKTLLDAANPLDFSAGFPPTLSVVNDDSLGEQVQRAHPGAHVVKGFNTISNRVMVNPGAIAGGDHDLFICGDDAGAKAEVRRLAADLGWSGEHVIDLGGIGCARGTEMYLALWVRLMTALGGGDFGVRVVR